MFLLCIRAVMLVKWTLVGIDHGFQGRDVDRGRSLDRGGAEAEAKQGRGRCRGRGRGRGRRQTVFGSDKAEQPGLSL